MKYFYYFYKIFLFIFIKFNLILFILFNLILFILFILIKYNNIVFKDSKKLLKFVLQYQYNLPEVILDLRY